MYVVELCANRSSTKWRSRKRLGKECVSGFDSIHPMPVTSLYAQPWSSQRHSALYRFLNDAVAVTSGRLQALAIENLDASAPVIFDQAFLLQDAGGNTYAGAVPVQHNPQVLLRQSQSFRLKIVAGYQQPA